MEDFKFNRRNSNLQSSGRVHISHLVSERNSSLRGMEYITGINNNIATANTQAFTNSG